MRAFRLPRPLAAVVEAALFTGEAIVFETGRETPLDTGALVVTDRRVLVFRGDPGQTPAVNEIPLDRIQAVSLGSVAGASRLLLAVAGEPEEPAAGSPAYLFSPDEEKLAPAAVRIIERHRRRATAAATELDIEVELTPQPARPAALEGSRAPPATVVLEAHPQTASAIHPAEQLADPAAEPRTPAVPFDRPSGDREQPPNDLPTTTADPVRPLHLGRTPYSATAGGASPARTQPVDGVYRPPGTQAVTLLAVAVGAGLILTLLYVLLAS